MSGSATLVMLVSITSRMAPSEAASVMTHLSDAALEQPRREGREQRRVGPVEGVRLGGGSAHSLRRAGSATMP